MRTVFLALGLMLAASTASAERISGPVVVIDGDTIVINGVVIRLEGIDAPELGQSCTRSNGKKWRCGKAAATELKTLTRSGTPACETLGTDQFDRTIGRCAVNGVDLGEALVQRGLAVAFTEYSETYKTTEDAARSTRAGIWATEFERPSRYRAKRWEVAQQSAPDPNCPIKGNINSKKERIYHTPWSRMYTRTKISTNKGERWFCTEGEALAAGWRAPLYD